jgi:hypothetical protein
VRYDDSDLGGRNSFIFVGALGWDFWGVMSCCVRLVSVQLDSCCCHQAYIIPSRRLYYIIL